MLGVSNETIVGGEGTGTLNIETGGLVRTDGLSIGTNGTLNLDGGTLELTDDMNFYDWAGTFDFTSGTIKVSNGAVITALEATTLNSNQTLIVTDADLLERCQPKHDS